MWSNKIYCWTMLKCENKRQDNFEFWAVGSWKNGNIIYWVRKCWERHTCMLSSRGLKIPRRSDVWLWSAGRRLSQHIDVWGMYVNWSEADWCHIATRSLNGETRKWVRIQFWETQNLIGGGLKKRKALSRKDENKGFLRYEKNQEHLVSQRINSFKLHFILTTLDERINGYLTY